MSIRRIEEPIKTDFGPDYIKLISVLCLKPENEVSDASPNGLEAILRSRNRHESPEYFEGLGVGGVIRYLET